MPPGELETAVYAAVVQTFQASLTPETVTPAPTQSVGEPTASLQAVLIFPTDGPSATVVPPNSGHAVAHGHSVGDADSDLWPDGDSTRPDANLSPAVADLSGSDADLASAVGYLSRSDADIASAVADLSRSDADLTSAVPDVHRNSGASDEHGSSSHKHTATSHEHVATGGLRVGHGAVSTFMAIRCRS